MGPEKSQRLQAIVRGRVQGVGFRYFVRQRAQALGVQGWVRNLPSGEVELIAEAEPALLESLLRAVREGPSGSAVTDIQTEWGDASGEFSGFGVRPTG